VHSVNLEVNSDRSCKMSALSLILGVGIKERSFSSSAISGVDNVCEDLLFMNLLVCRFLLCL